ncbi:MAG TPA: c-type cytochrome [Methylomirabilota bacterium]|jgi:cytochrome c oxidase subunit 2
MTRAALTLLLAITLGTLATPACAQDTVDQGQRYFMSNGCYGCHTVGKMGTPIGPDLSRVGAKYSRTYLERWLRDPSAQRPSAHMPALELSPQQVTDLAAFLSSLR